MTYRIITVCTGNICRSPMAEAVLRDRLEAAGLGAEVRVESAGTTGWETGEPIDPRARVELEARGIPLLEHRARQMQRRTLQDCDLILAMDHDHLDPIHRDGGATIASRVHLMRSFDPGAEGDLGIRDPWYGDDTDFASCFAMIAAAADGVVDHARSEIAARRA